MFCDRGSRSSRFAARMEGVSGVGLIIRSLTKKSFTAGSHTARPSMCSLHYCRTPHVPTHAPTCAPTERDAQRAAAAIPGGCCTAPRTVLISDLPPHLTTRNAEYQQVFLGWVLAGSAGLALDALTTSADVYRVRVSAGSPVARMYIP